VETCHTRLLQLLVRRQAGAEFRTGVAEGHVKWSAGAGVRTLGPDASTAIFRTDYNLFPSCQLQESRQTVRNVDELHARFNTAKFDDQQTLTLGLGTSRSLLQ
jgi:hypothetical protein